jgi:putative membrane protein insertion efficiency factor
LKLNSAAPWNDASVNDSTGDPGEPGLAARSILALIRVYKVIFSQHFAGSCRFLPSCADYAREAVLRYGAVEGSWLAARRLARCHPLCAAGHDPLPMNRSPKLRVESESGKRAASPGLGRSPW